MKKEDKGYIIKLTGFCIMIILLIICATELVIINHVEHDQAQLHNTLQNSGALIAQDLQRNISNGIFGADTLNTLLKINNYRIENFEDWGRMITSSRLEPGVVQLAPKGIVTHVYPLEGNEEYLGQNLLENKSPDSEISAVVRNKALIFTGPFMRVWDDQYTFIAKKPVFKKNLKGDETFWGFTLAVLMMEDILPQKIEFMETQGTKIRIEKDDPFAQENPVLFESEGWTGSYIIRMCVEVPNGKWILKLNHAPVTAPFYIVFRVIVLLLTIPAVGYFFILQYRMRSRQQEIIKLNAKLTKQTYEDELTCAGNRRACIQMLEKAMRQASRYKHPLSIAMIDLDKFKQINDRYGHPVGDQLLRHFADGLKNAVRRSDMVFRLGGDEFLIIFPNTSLEKSIKAVDNIIRLTKTHPFSAEKISLPVRFSLGLAESHSEDTVETLLNRADIKLYEAKAAGRNHFTY